MKDEYLEGYSDGQYEAGVIFLEELYEQSFVKRLWACFIILFNNKKKVEIFKESYKEMENERNG